MQNFYLLPVLYIILPITGIVRVTMLITAIERESVRNTGNAECGVDSHDIYHCKSPVLSGQNTLVRSKSLIHSL